MPRDLVAGVAPASSRLSGARPAHAGGGSPRQPAGSRRYQGHPAFQRASRFHAAPLVVLGLSVAVAAFIAAPGMLESPLGQRGVLALSIAGLLYALLLSSPRVGVPATLVYLAVMGGMRRWLIPVFAWAPTDPLLLVAPIVAVLTLITLLARGGLVIATPLGRLMLALVGVMVLQIGNPLQGGLFAGLAGALYYVAPVLWFFVGSAAGSTAVQRAVLATTVGIAVAAAVYGAYQMTYGFSVGEQAWIEINKRTYQSMNVGSTIRPFSFFTSFSEYAHFLGLGIVLLWAAFLRGKKAALLPLPFLALAAFFTSIRGIVVATLLATTVLWAIQSRSPRDWVPRGMLALAVAVVGLIWGLGHAHQAAAPGAVGSLIQHQTMGLLKPMDDKHSTAREHLDMFTRGLAQGFRQPLGMGLGVTNQAAMKFGENVMGSEVDLSNVFTAMGLLGGLIYTAMIVMIAITSASYWQRRRSVEALGILGTLVLGLGQWLTGGHYAACMLIWFLIGALDRAQKERMP